MGTLAAVLLGVAIVVAACGGGETALSGGDSEPTAASDSPADDLSPTSSSSGDSSQEDAASNAVAFASCMRANGVPDFPDPQASGGVRISGDIAGNPNFEPAMEACAHLMPSGPGTMMGGPVDDAAILEFAQCMRSNGVPDFPDPGSSGGALGQNDLGIDTSSPQFQSALEICGEQTGIQVQVRGE